MNDMNLKSAQCCDHVIFHNDFMWLHSKKMFIYYVQSIFNKCRKCFCLFNDYTNQMSKRSTVKQLVFEMTDSRNSFKFL